MKEKNIKRNGKARSEKKSHNIVPKLTCLLLAFILWLYVMDTENPDWEETYKSIPVSLINTDEIEIDNGLTIYSGYMNSVDITLRGRKTEISDVEADDISITADVIEIKEAGEYTLPIYVSVSGDVEVVYQSKETITVFVDKKETITVPVKTKYTDLVLSSEYSLGEPALSVETIKVTGPSRYLEDIDHAQLTVPELGRVTGSLTVYGDISLIDKDGGEVSNPYVTMTQTEASVTIPVYAKKEVPLRVAYKFGYFNEENSSVTLSTESIYVKGDAALISALESITVATIDEKSVEDDETITVPLVMPEGVENLSGEEFVDITIANVGTTTRMMMISTEFIKIQNPNDVQYSVKDNYVSVILRGTSDALYSLSYSSVNLKLDLSSYTTEHTGVFTVPISVEITSDKNIYELGDYSIEIELTGANEEKQ